MAPRQKRLLLVEDNPLVARGLARRLSHRFEVSQRSTAAAAMAETERFDLGVFDIDLPDGDGVSVAQVLAQRGTVTKLLFFSGCTQSFTISRASQVGTSLGKEAGVEALFSLIDELAGSDSGKAEPAKSSAVSSRTRPIGQEDLPRGCVR